MNPPVPNVCSGPCCYCGRRDFRASTGGPFVCSRCDCGHKPETIDRIGVELATARQMARNLYIALRLTQDRDSLAVTYAASALEKYQRSDSGLAGKQWDDVVNQIRA